MKNKEVARLLDSIADLLEIKGENTFRVGAYRSAARHIEGLSEDIAQIASAGALRSIPGVGESLVARITEYLETGRSQHLEDLKAMFPEGLIELLQIPGLGPKKTKLVYEKLGVNGIEDLEQALREHKLRDLPGMGEKTEQNIQKELERWRSRTRRHLLGDALSLAEEIAAALRSCPAAQRVEPGGSIRRRKETIGDVDILAASDHPDEVIACFDGLPLVKEVIARGSTKSSVLTRQDIQVDLRVVKPESFGAALQYFTGSKEHNVRLRELAQKRGLKINEYGVFDERTGERIGGENEEDIYRIVGLAYIPPEMREDRGEIEAAEKWASEGISPVLVETSDVRGDLHVHTNWSDGLNTLEEMAAAAIARGYDYIAICDHSKSLGVAHGLSPERVLEQRTLIDEANARLAPFRILAGIELDIRADGTLDYEDELLGQFDIVTASVHSGMGQPRDKITERIISALRNPHVYIFNHPTGRIIGRREPYDVDLERVFATAAELGVAMEINAAPDRLDLNDLAARRAKEYGIRIAINTDAHAAWHMDFMRYGVATARRAWLEKGDVLNTLPVDELLERLTENRASRLAERR